MMLIGSLLAGVASATPEPTPAKTKGQITGKIIKKYQVKITVKAEEGQLTLMPHWRGDIPKDGGGFDKGIMRQLEHFRVGDIVKITWVFSEHYRIEKIEMIEKGEKAKKSERREKDK
jgi:hypothetical protein